MAPALLMMPCGSFRGYALYLSSHHGAAYVSKLMEHCSGDSGRPRLTLHIDAVMLFAGMTTRNLGAGSVAGRWVRASIPATLESRVNRAIAHDPGPYGMSSFFPGGRCTTWYGRVVACVKVRVVYAFTNVAIRRKITLGKGDLLI